MLLSQQQQQAGHVLNVTTRVDFLLRFVVVGSYMFQECDPDLLFTSTRRLATTLCFFSVVCLAAWIGKGGFVAWILRQFAPSPLHVSV